MNEADSFLFMMISPKLRLSPTSESIPPSCRTRNQHPRASTQETGGRRTYVRCREPGLDRGGQQPAELAAVAFAQVAQDTAFGGEYQGIGALEQSYARGREGGGP